MAYPYAGDWRPRFCEYYKLKNEARERGLFTDIELTVGRGATARIFNAHKIILALGSPLFKDMFIAEGPEECKSHKFPDDEANVFDMMLTFIYGDEVKIKSFLDLWDLYNMGMKYQVIGFEQEVKKYIDNYNVEENDFWDVIQYNLYSIDLLLDKMKFFLMKNAELVLKSKNFLKVPYEVVKDIVQMNDSSMEALDILHYVTLWCYEKYGDGTNWDHLLPLLQHIDFSELTREGFCCYTELFPDAINIKDSLEILKHLEDRSNFKLPEWCLRQHGKDDYS